jgi:anaerobic selenocysteine-containing dehydrogenase
LSRSIASSETIHRTCNLCEATCGLLVEVEANRVVRIRADREDPFSRGHICPKAIALKQIQEDPDRLRRPIRRTARGWEEISWPEALDDVAENLARIQLRDGNDAVGVYLGNPAAHNFGTLSYITFLFQALSTRSRFSASSVDQNPKHASSLFLFGNTFSIPIPDIDRSDFLLMLGANPIVSNGSLMTAPGFRRRMQELKRRGGRFVVVDPRRSETAEIADEHLFIPPGGDALLLAALVHVVLEEKLGRECHFADLLDGSPALRDALAAFSPESVERRLQISAERIRALAREFAAAPSAVCYGRVGTSQNPYATLANWLVDVLNIVTGNLDRAGGAMFTTPAVDLLALIELRGGSGPAIGWHTRVRGAPAFNGEQPAACMSEEMLTPGPGQIRAMLTTNGNPVLSTPNGRELDRAFESLEYCAAIDIYRNETTRHANVILPPTWTLEHDNYEALFHLFAVHNSAKYSPPTLVPEPGALHEWQIILELALRIAEKKSTRPHVRLGLRALRAAKGFFHTRRMLDWMLRIGPYGDGFRPWRSGLRVKDLVAEPKGRDLGPLRPSLERVLHTASGRIDLAHVTMLAELRRLSAELASPAPGLVLVGRRDSRTNNSWLHNVPLAVKGRDRCTLLMHPADADERGLASEQAVRIRSRVGEVVATLEVSDEMMPGVVSLPHGWGHDRPGIAMRLAEANAHVSVNDLCDEQQIEPVVGNAVLNGVPVHVEPATP